MGCSCGQPKLFKILVQNKPCYIYGLDAIIQITYLSQPKDENDLKQILWENFCLYNDFGVEVDKNSYLEALTAIYYDVVSEWEKDIPNR